MASKSEVEIGAARRFMKSGSLEGLEHFIGKDIEVLREALAD